MIDLRNSDRVKFSHKPIRQSVGPIVYSYRFEAGVFEIPVGGATITLDFITDDPSPQLSDFTITFSSPTQTPITLTHVSGQHWQVAVTCEGGVFVDNFYRRQVYSNVATSQEADSNYIKYDGSAIDTPDYPPNNVPIP